MTSLRSVLALLFVATPLLSPLAAPLAAQEPVRPIAPVSPPPPAPAAARATEAPPANAVALCNDQSYIIAPAEPAACAARGGLKVTLPGARKAPQPAVVAPAIRAAETRPATTGQNDAPPAGATMRCKDGSWLAGAAVASRCDGNGGLAVILPALAPPPPAPARP